MEKIQFSPRAINIKDPTKIIFIVGMYPGKQRLKNKNDQVFHGNKTGDFVEHLIRNKDNLYLTNIFNYYTDIPINQFHEKTDLIVQGLNQLQEDIIKYNPIKIILLGNFSKKYFKTINYSGTIIYLKHPSYILRFNKSKKYYEENFRKALKNDN